MEKKHHYLPLFFNVGIFWVKLDWNDIFPMSFFLNFQIGTLSVQIFWNIITPSKYVCFKHVTLHSYSFCWDIFNKRKIFWFWGDLIPWIPLEHYGIPTIKEVVHLESLKDTWPWLPKSLHFMWKFVSSPYVLTSLPYSIFVMSQLW